jgi:hypothetical protein
MRIKTQKAASLLIRKPQLFSVLKSKPIYSKSKFAPKNAFPEWI